jgi:hypothetical protein
MTDQAPARGRVPGMPDDLARLLGQIVPPGGAFGHRQHVHLAFLTARAHGTQAAVAKISSWIRHIAAYEHAPQKYNATMTRAWTEIVGHHVEADPALADFGEFADRHPALLDKRLLRRHYSSAMLASAAARGGWVEPDLAPFPWSRV